VSAPADRIQVIKRESSVGGGDPAEDVDYFAPIDATEDAVEAQGLFIQPPGGPTDEACYITRNGAGDMLFKDPNNGSEQTLSSLVGGAGSFVSNVDFLLDNDPVAETGTNDCVYTPTYSSGKVSVETWKRDDNTKIKDIAYTYSGAKLSTEVRKVYALDGSTVLGQVTWTYTYSGNLLSSSTMIRNV
jgi:hypothetical protein